MVMRGLAKETMRLEYVPVGTLRLAKSADSVCKCSSSISSGSLSMETGCVPVSLGCSSAPVTSISKESTVTPVGGLRSEEHTSELQSRLHLVCRLLLEKKKTTTTI